MASEHLESLRVLRGHLDRQEWAQATVELEKLIQCFPEDLELRLRLGRLYLKAGEVEKALKQFHHCVRAFYERKRYEEAFAAARSILKHQPDHQFALEAVRRIRTKLDLVQKLAMHPVKEILLDSVSKEALEELASCLRVSVYQRGETIVEEGAPGFDFFVIHQGEVQVYVTDRNGYRFPLAVLMEGDFFGEIALVRGFPRTATVVATKRSELWVMGKADFRGFTRKYSRFREVVYRYSQERIRDTLWRIRAHGIERRSFPRVPVQLEAQVILLGDQEDDGETGALAGLVKNISQAGVCLRAPVSNPQQWVQLRQRRRGRLSSALTPFATISATCSVERTQLKREGEQVCLELGLSFEDLTSSDKEQIGEFVVGQLVR